MQAFCQTTHNVVPIATNFNDKVSVIKQVIIDAWLEQMIIDAWLLTATKKKPQAL